MGKIVAARFWNCEFCDTVRYSYEDIVRHLKIEHDIDVKSPLSNAGLGGDNLMVSDLVIPEKLMSIAEV